MASKDEVPKGIKILVISMGVLLVGGFFAVVGIVATKLSHHPNGEAPASASAFGVEACQARQIAVPEGFELEDIYAEKGTVTALISNDEVMRVLTIDACTGRILTDLAIGSAKDIRKTPVDYSF